MVWGKAGSTTLSSSGDDLDITSMTANDFNQFIVHSITSGNMKHNFRFDDNSGSVYARGRSYNGAGKSNDSSQAQIEYHGDTAEDRFEVIYGVNLTGEEKLQIHHCITQGGSGSGTAPNRSLAVSKAVITNQYTRVDCFNDGAGSFDTGSNITVLGSDMTPDAGVTAIDNVQDNSLFIEKDTAKRYWSSGYLPANTATHSDDFSSDGWTDNDSTNMGVSGGTFNWNAKRDGTNDASTYDLTSTSANWVLRFKLKVTNVSSSTQAGNGFYVGLSDKNQTAGQSTSQDFIGVSIYNDNTDTYRTIDADGSSLPRIYQGDSNQATTYNTNSTWYYEIIKTGSSYTVEAFSGSDYSTGSEGKITGSSNATGLRYLKVLNDMESISTSTNPFQGTIDDLKFYNNVTNVDVVPATWITPIDLSELKAYYTFSQASGDITNDATAIGSTASIGSGADLQVSGATYGASGKVGNSLSFDGTNDYCVAGSSVSQFNFMHKPDFTVSLNVWVKLDTVSSDYDCIFNTSIQTTNIGYSVARNHNANTFWNYITNGSSGQSEIGNSDSGLADVDTWTMLTFTMDDANNEIKFYKNGVLFTTATPTERTQSTSNASYAGRWGQQANGSTMEFGGEMNEASIWNRVLTASEIADIYTRNSIGVALG